MLAVIANCLFMLVSKCKRTASLQNHRPKLIYLFLYSRLAKIR